jgi:hypothetical protein
MKISILKVGLAALFAGSFMASVTQAKEAEQWRLADVNAYEASCTDASASVGRMSATIRRLCRFLNTRH